MLRRVRHTAHPLLDHLTTFGSLDLSLERNSEEENDLEDGVPVEERERLREPAKVDHLHTLRRI